MHRTAAPPTRQRESGPALTAAVRDARRHFMAARRITRAMRLAHYQGRNSRSTYATRDAHLRQAANAARTAGQLAGGRRSPVGRELEGRLWAEHRLAGRLGQARDDQTIRPELAARQAACRRAIRALIAQAAATSRDHPAREDR